MSGEEITADECERRGVLFTRGRRRRGRGGAASDGTDQTGLAFGSEDMEAGTEEDVRSASTSGVMDHPRRAP